MASLSRTVKIPTRPTAQMLAWPPKDPADTLDYTLDASAWLAEGGRTLVSCDAYADPSLTATGKVVSQTSVTLTIAGGVSGSVPIVPFLLHCDGGNQLIMPVKMPVQSRLPVPVVVPGSTGSTGPVSTDALAAEATAREIADAANAKAIADEIAARELAGYLTASQVSGIVDAALSHALAGYVTVSTVNSAVAAGQEFVFPQTEPSAQWTIVHNMGRRPAVTIVATSGDIVEGDVHYLDNNVVTATFGAAIAGTAYLT